MLHQIWVPLICMISVDHILHQKNEQNDIKKIQPRIESDYKKFNCSIITLHITHNRFIDVFEIISTPISNKPSSLTFRTRTIGLFLIALSLYNLRHRTKPDKEPFNPLGYEFISSLFRNRVNFLYRIARNGFSINAESFFDIFFTFGKNCYLR